MKTVIEMARDAGATDLVSSLTHPKGPTTALRFGLDNGSLERFAELVRADAIAEEREACAKVCDEQYYQHLGPEYGEVRYGMAACAATI